MTILMAVLSLVFVAPCGLPLAPGLPARGLVGGHRARRGHGAAALVAGLLGPIAIAVYAAVLSLPVWIAWWWLARRG